VRRRGPFTRALAQMRRDWWLQGVAISSLAVSLAIVGFYLTLVLNLQQAVTELETGAGIMVALEDGVGQQVGRELARRLERRPEVARARFVGHREALERFRRQLGPHRGLLEGMEDNPLPDTVEVSLRPGARTEPLLAFIQSQPGVQQVVTSRPWLQRLEQARRVLADAAMALGILLFLGVVFLVSATVRLSVYVRRQELEIMALVGASRGYLRRPFLIEAMLQGLLAAGLASLVVWGLLRLLATPAYLPLGLDLERLLAFPWPQVPAALAALGLLAGLLGGFWGVGRALGRRGL